MGLVLDPGITGLVIAYGYVLQAPLGVLTAPVRESLLGQTTVLVFYPFAFSGICTGELRLKSVGVRIVPGRS